MEAPRQLARMADRFHVGGSHAGVGHEPDKREFGAPDPGQLRGRRARRPGMRSLLSKEKDAGRF